MINKQSSSSSINKINAPEFAYKCVYSKLPSTSLRGMYSSHYKKYHDFYIDESLDTHIIDQLNAIRNIEIRSICAGHNKDRVTHIIFRPDNQKLEFIKNVVNQLNFDNTKSIYDVGNGNKYRICVATRNWYRENANNSNWESWWKMIPKKINKAVN